jgi:hypothetical protein
LLGSSTLIRQRFDVPKSLKSNKSYVERIKKRKDLADSAESSMTSEKIRRNLGLIDKFIG